MTSQLKIASFSVPCLTLLCICTCTAPIPIPQPSSPTHTHKSDGGNFTFILVRVAYPRIRYRLFLPGFFFAGQAFSARVAQSLRLSELIFRTCGIVDVRAS